MTESLAIYGYRWRDEFNTYHSVIVFVDGTEIYRSDKMEYGYGEQYQISGFREFRKWAKIDKYSNDVPWHYCDRNGIHYETAVYDVKRKRELFAFAPFGGAVRNSGNTLP